MDIIVGIIFLVWLIANLAQLYFWLQVVMPLGLYGSINRPGMKDPVSVVVCTNRFDEGFIQLITDLSVQDYPDYEVIIVNVGSIPEVSEAILAAAGKDPQFRELPFSTATKMTGGKKEPLAAGIQKARFPWILVTDGDCRVGPSWISSMMRNAGRKKRLVLGYSPLRATGGPISLLARFDNVMIALQYLGLALRGRPYMGVGRNMLYSSDLFARTGDFESHRDLLSGDDDLFVQEAATPDNTTICIAPEAFAWSEGPRSPGAFVSRKRRHASTARYYSRRSRRDLLMIGGSFILFWLLTIPSVLVGEIIPGILVVTGVLVQWIVFGIAASRLQQGSQILIFPLLAFFYALFLCLMGIFALLKPPDTWKS